MPRYLQKEPRSNFFLYFLIKKLGNPFTWERKRWLGYRASKIRLARSFWFGQTSQRFYHIKAGLSWLGWEGDPLSPADFSPLLSRNIKAHDIRYQNENGKWKNNNHGYAHTCSLGSGYRSYTECSSYPQGLNLDLIKFGLAVLRLLAPKFLRNTYNERREWWERKSLSHSLSSCPPDPANP